MDPDLLDKPVKETRAERIVRLTETLENRKREFTKLSQEIFHFNQEFNTKCDEAKHEKASVSRLMKEYVANNTEVALKEAELAVKMQILQDKTAVEDEITNDRKSDIQESRSELERLLSVYHECRKNLVDFENSVTKDTDEARMTALNQVAFMKHAQATIMAEVRRVSDHSYFPSKKDAAIIRDECIRHVEKSSRLLKRLYREKLIDFRRSERILTGRRKELIERAVMKDMKAYENIENQLIATTTRNPMFEVDMSPTNPETHFADLPHADTFSPRGVPGSRTPHTAPRSSRSSVSSSRRRPKGAPAGSTALPSMSLSYGGSVIDQSKRLTTPSVSVSNQHEAVESHLKLPTNLLYDASKFECYTHFENMKYGTLLSTVHDPTEGKKSVAGSKQLQRELRENDEYLVNLALSLATIEGKQKELTAIKEGLDIQLIKQAHMTVNLTADLYKRVGLPLPAVLKAPSSNVTIANTLKNSQQGPVTLNNPQGSPGRKLVEILKDKSKADLCGAIAGQYRYAFDPYLDVRACQKDITTHEQLLGELNYQTKTLFGL